MAIRREKSKKLSKSQKTVIIILIAAAVLFGCFLSAGAFMPEDRIANNVVAGNTDLGGMTLSEAQDAIATDNFYEGKIISITSHDTGTQFTAEDIALAPDPVKTAQKAFEVGKSKNIFKNSCDFFRLLFTKEDISYVPSVDEGALDNLLYSFGATFNGEFTDFEITLDGDKATVTPRIAGQDTNTETARSEVLSSIENGVFTDIPVTLNKSDTSPITADELYERLYALPQDAEYQYDGNEISIKEEVVGIDVDKNILGEYADILNEGQFVTIPVKLTAHGVTAETLQAKLFIDTLASYSTSYSTSDKNRASNVALAASSLNGTIVMPGDTFSYNETIGDTTLENGYKVASVYENGKTSTGVGGGICQVSSTLYSAVLYADLKVVERRNHSLTVGYVPKGQDATVSYGAIDFKFSNNTDYPIKISSAANGGTLTVSIIGTKRDVERTVQLTHTVISTTQPTTNETPDPSLPLNTRKVTSAGKTGYVVDTVKTVYENGVQISSEKITRSTYKMVPTEVSVGTKEDTPVYAVPTPAPTPEPTPAPTPEQPSPETAADPAPEAVG